MSGDLETPHSSPTITLVFEQADHAQAAREALEASYVAMANIARP